MQVQNTQTHYTFKFETFDIYNHETIFAIQKAT